MLYLELKNDDTACFYEDPDLEMRKFSFKFKRYCFPSTKETLCFEADITKTLRYDFQKLGVNINEYESKLYFALMADGALGWDLKIERLISFN